MLIEFLTYIETNQYIDDVRVMNIVTNVQEPYTLWSKTPPDQRSGILDPAIEMLRDFKVMFE